jgi:hypothetical protein
VGAPCGPRRVIRGAVGADFLAHPGDVRTFRA